MQKIVPMKIKRTSVNVAGEIDRVSSSRNRRKIVYLAAYSRTIQICLTHGQ